MSWTDRIDDELAERDVAEADNQLEQTNQLLAQLVESMTGEDPNVDLGYYSGGSSTASSAAERSTSSEGSAESTRDQRQHFGGAIQIDADDTKAAPVRVALPFAARLLDVRQWSGTIYVAIDDPTDSNDDTLWAAYDGTSDDPVTEIPAAGSDTLWLASPDGATASPQIDAWRSGLGGGE